MDGVAARPSYLGTVPVVVARSLVPVYDTRQIVPPMSSAISSYPSFITAKAAGRPHTSAHAGPRSRIPSETFVAAVGPAILEPDHHNLIAGGLRTIRRHCFHFTPCLEEKSTTASI